MLRRLQPFLLILLILQGCLDSPPQTFYDRHYLSPDEEKIEQIVRDAHFSLIDEIIEDLEEVESVNIANNYSYVYNKNTASIDESQYIFIGGTHDDYKVILNNFAMIKYLNKNYKVLVLTEGGNSSYHDISYPNNNNHYILYKLITSKVWHNEFNSYDSELYAVLYTKIFDKFFNFLEIHPDKKEKVERMFPSFYNTTWDDISIYDTNTNTCLSHYNRNISMRKNLIDVSYLYLDKVGYNFWNYDFDKFIISTGKLHMPYFEYNYCNGDKKYSDIESFYKTTDWKNCCGVTIPIFDYLQDKKFVEITYKK